MSLTALLMCINLVAAAVGFEVNRNARQPWEVHTGLFLFLSNIALFTFNGTIWAINYIMEVN